MAPKSFQVICSFVFILLTSTAFAGAAKKVWSLDEILKMQSSVAKHESAKPGQTQSLNFTINAAPNDANSCTIGGGRCHFDSDCCSNNCTSNVCQAGAGGCTIGGGSCHFDNDCCSSNCMSNVCQSGAGGCTDGGGRCHFDSDCCSNNCYSGTCQAACGSTGSACRYDQECCAGNCNNAGRCGNDNPNCAPSN